MNYEVWGFVFAGMMASILLLNTIQWVTYRTRIYGLYTLYILAWFLRVQSFGDWLPQSVSYFIRATASMIAFYLYFDFSDAFLNLRERLPALYNQLRYAKGVILVYIGFQFILCFLWPTWQPDLYETSFTLMRALLAVAGFYWVYVVLRLKDTVSRYFIAGTIFMQVGALINQIVAFFHPVENLIGPFWNVSLAYLQVGIILELICFSLGLNYGQRRIAVSHAVMEKELAREREQRHREQLEAELALQRLEQEKVLMNMRALQVQVNPHFLFNSLNVLDSLIDDNPQQASAFLEEMSTVYRYLLRSNEQALTDLATELNFIHSYFHLLKTRHGNGLQLHLEINDQYLNHQIPPLTLQLLVENAVKHNIVLPEQPLSIYIRTPSQDRLVVYNNIQRKTVRVDSNGIGLSNILTKYQMLGQTLPTIQEVDEQFVVTLPLIQ